jgi:hypothetical protein
VLLSLIAIIVIGGFSIYFADLNAESAFATVVLPLAILLSLIGLALWFVCLFHKLGVKQVDDSSAGGVAGGFSSGDSGGGDGGAC